MKDSTHLYTFTVLSSFPFTTLFKNAFNHYSIRSSPFYFPYITPQPHLPTLYIHNITHNEDISFTLLSQDLHAFCQYFQTTHNAKQKH